MRFGLGLGICGMGRASSSVVLGGAGASLVAPPGATGWWKGYSGLYSDAGATPASVDGTAVYRVGDNAGSNPADQSSASLRPILKTGQMASGRSVLQYDGSDDFSVAALNGSGYATLTFGCLVRPLDTASTKGIISWGNSLSSGVPFIIVQRDSTNVRFYVDAGYRFSIPHAAGDFAAYVLSYNGTQWGLVVNGAAQVPYVGTKAQQANASNIYFGNGFNGYANCDIGEVIVYNSAVDADALSSYLMSIGGL